jgi:putative oxidoreductase
MDVQGKAGCLPSHVALRGAILTPAGQSLSLPAVNSLGKYSSYVYAILRIILGLLFACHGGQKILGFPPPAKAMQLDTLGMVGGYIELICGFLIALGLLTRPAAFLASGMMAVAYFMAHAGNGFFPIINRGEPAVLYCFVFLYFFFRGGGPFAIDNLIFGHRIPDGEVGGPARVGSHLS